MLSLPLYGKTGKSPLDPNGTEEAYEPLAAYLTGLNDGITASASENRVEEPCCA